MATKRSLSRLGPRWIVLFDSVHHVLAAERALKNGRVAHDLVPVPKELSSDCGMAIELREADAPAAFRLLDDPSMRWRRIFKRRHGGFQPVAAPAAAETEEA
jgi:hypothetical protein